MSLKDDGDEEDNDADEYTEFFFPFTMKMQMMVVTLLRIVKMAEGGGATGTMPTMSRMLMVDGDGGKAIWR